jgi:hypothetical protein
MLRLGASASGAGSGVSVSDGCARILGKRAEGCPGSLEMLSQKKGDEMEYGGGVDSCGGRRSVSLGSWFLFPSFNTKRSPALFL